MPVCRCRRVPHDRRTAGGGCTPTVRPSVRETVHGKHIHKLPSCQICQASISSLLSSHFTLPSVASTIRSPSSRLNFVRNGHCRRRYRRPFLHLFPSPPLSLRCAFVNGACSRTDKHRRDQNSRLVALSSMLPYVDVHRLIATTYPPCHTWAIFSASNSHSHNHHRSRNRAQPCT